MEKKVFASDFLSDFNEVIFVRDWTTFPEDAGINKDVQLRTLNLSDVKNRSLVDSFIDDSYAIGVDGIVNTKSLIVSYDSPKNGVLNIGLNSEGENYLRDIALPSINYNGNGTGTGR